MVNVIDMQDLRHLNLFSKITRIDTRFCFSYNNVLVFCVPKKLMSKAIGEDAKNLKRMSEILKRRVRVVAQPRGIEDAKSFIEAVISPVKFNEIEINEDEIIVTGGMQNKAALIGRNKRRLVEMQKIVKDFFKRDFKVA
jgi:transcription antitermination factor NusA-like protein